MQSSHLVGAKPAPKKRPGRPVGSHVPPSKNLLHGPGEKLIRELRPLFEGGGDGGLGYRPPHSPASQARDQRPAAYRLRPQLYPEPGLGEASVVEGAFGKKGVDGMGDRIRGELPLEQLPPETKGRSLASGEEIQAEGVGVGFPPLAPEGIELR